MGTARQSFDNGPAHPPPLPHSPGVWKRSSRCATSECVEVNWISDEMVAIRDSKLAVTPGEPPLIQVDRLTFETFLRELTGSEAPGANGRIVVDRRPDGWVALRSVDDGVTLTFDANEFEAFLEGARAGEFGRTPLPA